MFSIAIHQILKFIVETFNECFENETKTYHGLVFFEQIALDCHAKVTPT